MSEADGVCYRLVGRVGFDNLMEIREAGESAIAEAGDEAVIDLSGLDNGNSASVALLMAWFRQAESLEKTIRFVGPPEELQSIVELSGLADVLPLEVSA